MFRDYDKKEKNATGYNKKVDLANIFFEKNGKNATLLQKIKKSFSAHKKENEKSKWKLNLVADYESKTVQGYRINAGYLFFKKEFSILKTQKKYKYENFSELYKFHKDQMWIDKDGKPSIKYAKIQLIAELFEYIEKTLSKGKKVVISVNRIERTLKDLFNDEKGFYKRTIQRVLKEGHQEDIFTIKKRTKPGNLINQFGRTRYSQNLCAENEYILNEKKIKELKFLKERKNKHSEGLQKKDATLNLLNYIFLKKGQDEKSNSFKQDFKKDFFKKNNKFKFEKTGKQKVTVLFKELVNGSSVDEKFKIRKLDESLSKQIMFIYSKACDKNIDKFKQAIEFIVKNKRFNEEKFNFRWRWAFQFLTFLNICNGVYCEEYYKRLENIEDGEEMIFDGNKNTYQQEKHFEQKVKNVVCESALNKTSETQEIKAIKEKIIKVFGEQYYYGWLKDCVIKQIGDKFEIYFNNSYAQSKVMDDFEYKLSEIYDKIYKTGVLSDLKS